MRVWQDGHVDTEWLMDAIVPRRLMHFRGMTSAQILNRMVVEVDNKEGAPDALLVAVKEEPGLLGISQTQERPLRRTALLSC